MTVLLIILFCLLFYFFWPGPIKSCKHCGANLIQTLREYPIRKGPHLEDNEYASEWTCPVCRRKYYYKGNKEVKRK